MKADRKDILVPVDFGIHSQKALRYAGLLNQQINGKIYLLHVVFIESWWPYSLKINELKLEAEKRLKELIEKFNLPENTAIQVTEGKRAEKILEYANTLEPRYIILADNYPASKGVKKLGSTLSQVIISAKFPVITVKSVPETIFKNVLLPLDLTHNCGLKLFKSVTLAQTYKSTIHIVSVLFGNVRRSNRRLNRKLSKYKNIYEKNNINYSIKLFKKKNKMAYKEILDEGAEKKCDAILIMTHKETGIDNYLGAFAHHIINESEIPVISITKQAAKEKNHSYLTPFIDPFGILKNNNI